MPESRPVRSTTRLARSQRATDVAALQARVVQLEATLEEAVDRQEDLVVEAARLRAILAAVPVWVSYIDRDNTYRFTNWAAHGKAPETAGEPTGRLVSEVLGDDLYRAIRPDLDRSLRGELVVRDRTVPLRGKRTASFRTTYSPHFAADGKVNGSVVVVGRAEDFEHPGCADGLTDATPPRPPGIASRKVAMP